MAMFSVDLGISLPEMAREEVQKQITFLSEKISNSRFSEDGTRLQFDAPPPLGDMLSARITELARRLENALRNVPRKTIFRSSACDSATFARNVSWEGVSMVGPGQVALSGLPLHLFRYFDRLFESFGSAWVVEHVMVPTLVPSSVLSRCDYFRSFPHSLTFAGHLKPDAGVISSFRARHETAKSLDHESLADMETPEACLSPAVCYHIYHLNENRALPAAGRTFAIWGKCFRFENKNMVDLRRLWDFTMREVVFLGSRETVENSRGQSIEMMCEFLEQHRLAGEIRTASDPFFVAPEAASKACFQLSSESKFEVSLFLPEGERIAVASHNYHGDFFGRAFNITVEPLGHSHTACVAFGLERWVYAFLAQHGSDISRWPPIVRSALEFR
jgi:seryl-tRNA synthetase